jgi:hypothetical protein
MSTAYASRGRCGAGLRSWRHRHLPCHSRPALQNAHALRHHAVVTASGAAADGAPAPTSSSQLSAERLTTAVNVAYPLTTGPLPSARDLAGRSLVLSLVEQLRCAPPAGPSGPAAAPLSGPAPLQVPGGRRGAAGRQLGHLWSSAQAGAAAGQGLRQAGGRRPAAPAQEPLAAEQRAAQAAGGLQVRAAGAPGCRSVCGLRTGPGLAAAAAESVPCAAAAQRPQPHANGPLRALRLL